jgi:4-hydroxy-tetrahydrodipicolinate synthase
MPLAELPRPLRGVIPPLVTPLAERDALDAAGLERLLEHVLAGGAHGLFLLGTTGEGPALSHRLRRQLVTMVCDQVAGRAPVLVGITDTSLVESLELAEHAHASGAAAVVTAPPYYFPATQAELLNYMERLTAELPLPLLLYNMPGCVKTAFEPQTLRACADLPGVIGVKDSSGDLDYFRHICELMSDRPDFALLLGPEEHLAAALEFGAHGGVSGGANLCPRLYVDLYEASVAGDAERVARLQARVAQIGRTIYAVSPHRSRVIVGLKTALRLLGLCDDLSLQAFPRATAAERDHIRAALEALDLHPVAT